MKGEKKFVILIGILLLITILLEFASFVSSPKQEVVFTTDQGKVSIIVEIADDPSERSQGLMDRTKLCEKCGMLFIFDQPQEVSFWMKNTLIPLDMIFVSEDMKIVKVHENVQPCESDPCPTYSSDESVKYVVETNADFVRENGIEVGNIILIN